MKTPQDKIERSIDVSPKSCDVQGNIFLAIQLRKPLRVIPELRVQIGTKDVPFSIQSNPWAIFCLIPAGEVGKVDVTISDEQNELARETGIFTYVKELEASARNTDEKASTSSSTNSNSKKPGDPTRPASNWWMLNRDLEHTSRVPIGNIVPFTELWHRTFPKALTFSQPIVGDGVLLVGIFGNGDEAFAALDSETGNLLWARTKDQNEGAVVWGTPVAANGRVYFIEAITGVMQLTCLKITDGSEIWSVGLPSWSQAGLAAAFGNIYFLTRDGVLRAHDAITGAERWSTPGINVGSGQTLSSPAIGFGNVYVGSHEGLRAFDANTGAPKWAAIDSLSNGNASPLLVYDVGVGQPAVVAIGCNDNKLRGYHATSGQLLWLFTGDMPLWYTTPATNDQKIYLRQATTLVELQAGTGQLIRTSPDLGGSVGEAPTVVGDHLFAVMQDDRLVALSLATFDLVQQRDIPSHGDSRPSIEENRIFISAGELAPYPAPRDTIHAFHKGCLIATAAYGSPMALPVAFLRNVRDQRLRQTRLGNALMNSVERVYYKFSPHVSEAMTQSPLLKRVMRWFVVTPIVSLLMIIVKPSAFIMDRFRRTMINEK